MPKLLSKALYSGLINKLNKNFIKFLIINLKQETKIF